MRMARPLPSKARVFIIDSARLAKFVQPMCNHYRQHIRKGVEIPGWSSGEFPEIRIPLRFDKLSVDVYPDKPGLVLRQQGDGLQFTAMRWGFPKVENQWVTNARNVMNRTGPAPFWADWTGPEYRCLVPASSSLNTTCAHADRAA